MRWIALCLRTFPDTFNVVVDLIENFLEPLEKKFELKTWGFVRIFELDFELHFQNLNFFHFSWHIIGLVCRTVTIVLPMQRDMLNGPPRYFERCRKAYRKFFRGTWRKIFSSKYEVLSEYSNPTLGFIFQNLNFFRFSWHIIGLVCRIVTIFWPTQRLRLSKPHRYLKRVRKAYRKFSRDIWN